MIPIIAKADCMTSEEREEFRERIINALKNPSLPSECRWLGEAQRMHADYVQRPA